MFSRQVQVDRGVLDFGVPQQYLNGAQIGAGFEQMCRETVPNKWGETCFVMPAL